MLYATSLPLIQPYLLFMTNSKITHPIYHIFMPRTCHSCTHIVAQIHLPHYIIIIYLCVSLSPPTYCMCSEFFKGKNYILLIFEFSLISYGVYLNSQNIADDKVIFDLMNRFLQLFIVLRRTAREGSNLCLLNVSAEGRIQGLILKANQKIYLQTLTTYPSFLLLFKCKRVNSPSSECFFPFLAEQYVSPVTYLLPPTHCIHKTILVS